MSPLTRSSFGLRPTPSLSGVVPTLKHAAIEANSSASQIKSWNLCKRLWFFEKICGIKQREAQHFIIGTVLHGVAERYLAGTFTSWEGLFPEGWSKRLSEYESNWVQRMAMKAVEGGLWQAAPGSQVEVPIAFLVGDEHVDARGLPLLAKADTYQDDHGIRRVGKITTMYDGSPLPANWNRLPPYIGFIDHLSLWDNPPRVTDHKTAKNRTYATTASKLAEDTQVISYAALPMVLRPEVAEVRVRHAVFIKEEGGPDPYPVEVPITLEKVLATWKAIRQASADMQALRVTAPKITIEGNPFARANNWQKVKSAIEEGRAKEACSCYGGCKFKDICFGRATAEQVVRRMDSPDQMPLVRRDTQPEQKFGLKGRPPTTPSRPYDAPSRFPTRTPPPSQEPQMPFAAKPLTVNQDVYIIDPEDAATQYRARITEHKADGSVALALYPNADVVPDFTTLSARYRIDVPAAQALGIPSLTAKVKGYQDALIAVGVADGLEWQAAAVGGTPALAATTKPVTKPPRDGAFGIKGIPGAAPTPPAASTPAPATTLAAPIPLPPGTPAWALPEVADGTVVVVKPSTHSFWSTLVGKRATVYATGPGEIQGSTDLSVMIDGLPHQGVNAHRFEPEVVDVAKFESGVPEEVAKFAASQQYVTLLASMTIQQRAAVFKGQVVTITQHSVFSSTNCMLDDMDDNGLVLMGGRLKIAWADVKAIEPMGAIPGAPPTKEEKAAAKEAAKAAKLAAKEAEKATKDATTTPPVLFAAQEAAKAGQQSVPGTEAIIATNPATALYHAIEAISVALNGGKVTRKVLEGVLPLLQSAQQYQDAVIETRDADVTGAEAAGRAKAPPLFTQPEALNALEAAKQAFDKAHDMVVKAWVF